MALNTWSTGRSWQIHQMSASVLWTMGRGGRRISRASQCSSCREEAPANGFLVGVAESSLRIASFLVEFRLNFSIASLSYWGGFPWGELMLLPQFTSAQFYASADSSILQRKKLWFSPSSLKFSKTSLPLMLQWVSQTSLWCSLGSQCEWDRSICGGKWQETTLNEFETERQSLIPQWSTAIKLAYYSRQTGKRRAMRQLEVRGKLAIPAISLSYSSASLIWHLILILLELVSQAVSILKVEGRHSLGSQLVSTKEQSIFLLLSPTNQQFLMRLLQKLPTCAATTFEQCLILYKMVAFLETKNACMLIEEGVVFWARWYLQAPINLSIQLLFSKETLLTAPSSSRQQSLFSLSSSTMWDTDCEAVAKLFRKRVILIHLGPLSTLCPPCRSREAKLNFQGETTSSILLFLNSPKTECRMASSLTSSTASSNWHSCMNWSCKSLPVCTARPISQKSTFLPTAKQCRHELASVPWAKSHLPSLLADYSYSCLTREGIGCALERTTLD